MHLGLWFGFSALLTSMYLNAWALLLKPKVYSEFRLKVR